MRIVEGAACPRIFLCNMFLPLCHFGKAFPVQLKQIAKFHVKCQGSPGGIALMCGALFCTTSIQLYRNLMHQICKCVGGLYEKTFYLIFFCMCFFLS